METEEKVDEQQDKVLGEQADTAEQPTNEGGDGTDEDQGGETDPASPDTAPEDTRPTAHRVIEINLTDEEKLDLAQRVVETLAKIEELESDKAEASKGYKKKIDAHAVELHELGAQYRRGYRSEGMDCPIEFNWELNEKHILHPVTGVVLHTDAVCDRDRKQYLPGFENQVDGGDGEDPKDPEGELMKCVTNVCDDELDGNCTKPTGDISCSGYKAPVEESEVGEDGTSGEASTGDASDDTDSEAPLDTEEEDGPTTD